MTAYLIGLSGRVFERKIFALRRLFGGVFLVHGVLMAASLSGKGPSFVN